MRYILYTGAGEHGKELVQDRTTGPQLRQGGSSWTTAPTAVVPAERPGTQPCTLQLRSLLSNPSPKANPKACRTAGREQRHPHQQQLQDRSSSYSVLWLISKQRSTVCNSQTLRESDGHHGGVLSVSNDYQLYPVQPSRDCHKESLFHQSQETASDSGQRIPNILLPVAMTKLPNFLKQAVKRANSPMEVYPWSATTDEWTKLFSTETETFKIDMVTEPPSPMFCYDAGMQPKTNAEPSWDNTIVFLGNNTQIFPKPLCAHGNSAEECMGPFTDLEKKVHARHLI